MMGNGEYSNLIFILEKTQNKAILDKKAFR